MKLIQLNHVLPDPLIDQQFKADCIWDKTIDIKTNSFTLLRASSGLGKSSLVSFITGLRNDFKGNITIDSKNIEEYSFADWSLSRAQKIAVVYQDLKLINHLSVIENLKLKHAIKNNVDIKWIDDALIMFKIDHIKGQSIQTLSQGQKQRVAIVRALIQPFDIIVLDEPFSHLDKENIKIAVSIITQRCTEEKAGLLLASLGDDYAIPFQNYIYIH